jgi:hypothetical protein
MEARQFDALAKAAGSEATRRRVLRGLLAGAGSGLLALRGARTGAASACSASKLCKGACKTCDLLSGRCVYRCDPVCEVCSASEDACVARTPLPEGCPVV